jgi:fructose-1,6-bisphosphatase/sedoheptulose 1,7-bisphosphatase-like protein
MMMKDDLRWNISDKMPTYESHGDELIFDQDRILEFNHRHKSVLANYDLQLDSCKIKTLSDRVNFRSNLGGLRNRKIRQSVVLSAALSAIGVSFHGRGSLNHYPEEERNKELTNRLKRSNDRTAAQIMSEVLQTTIEALPVGEEALIESVITEGVRVKPGKEAGGNPTIAVGAVFGKDHHRANYGLTMPRNVTLLSMGNDVIEGTTKSVKGLHSSMTALFVTETNVKRHLPDIYLQRWMAGTHFKKFNPRRHDLLDAADIIASSYDMSGPEQLSSFFLDRPRHYYAMDVLNEAGVVTPFDQDGDMLPGIILGLEGLGFPGGHGLNAMIGEIGGSAEWAVSALPLVWRGGQALGMLTSQSSLTRKDLSPEDKWKERFHFTEEEFMLIQDARFERKPYFTIWDILEDPYAGGISAFGAITDNCYIPLMKGVSFNPERSTVDASVLVVNSLGMVECWIMGFCCTDGLDRTKALMASPKEELQEMSGGQLEQTIAAWLDNDRMKRRFRIFFNNEYYPALIPIQDRIVMLHHALNSLMQRGVLDERDKEIVLATERLAGDWFINSE